MTFTRRCLVTGAGGQLGSDLVALGAVAADSTWEIVGLGRAALDVTHREAVFDAVTSLSPDLVIHAGAWTEVDACEGDRARAFSVNALGTRHVAEAASRVKAHVCYISTDYVFDGTKPSPYDEWDAPNPLSVYGASKLAGETELPPGATVIRSSWICGAVGKNMVRTILRLAGGPGTLKFVDDQQGCPTFTEDLARAVWKLARDRRPGVIHVTNQGATTWYGFARAVMAASGDDPDRVEPIATGELDPPRPAPRPANSVLNNAVLRLAGDDLLPDWHDGLERLVGQILHEGHRELPV